MMTAIFVFIKCELGYANDVAADLVDNVENVSEVYSTSGQHDLLAKFQLPKDADIGTFVTKQVQTRPHIRDTFTVITTAANETLQALHERMPVILQPWDYGPWLNRDTPPERLVQLLAPGPDAMLSMHPVSKAVGNVRNEGAQLIAPEPVPQPR